MSNKHFIQGKDTAFLLMVSAPLGFHGVKWSHNGKAARCLTGSEVS
jgi:hypothetical protein